MPLPPVAVPIVPLPDPFGGDLGIGVSASHRTDDLIHIVTEVQARLGRRMAEVAPNKVCALPGHATAIDLASVTVLPMLARPVHEPRRTGTEAHPTTAHVHDPG